MELRHLRYFQALAEELSFRKASERLSIAQPGLSRQIKQLEDLLNAQLLLRTKRSVKLTPAGMYFKTEVERILNQVDQATKQVALIDQGDFGEIRIGFVGSAIHHVLPKLIARINKRYPNIHTSLDELANHVQISMIMSDKLDLGFVRVTSIPSTLESRVVHEDSFSVVLPAGHPMTPESFVDMGQLKEEKFILFSSEYSSEYYDKVVSICRDQGFEPTVSHKSIHAFTIFKLVESGLGIAIVPTSLVDGYELNIKSIALTSIPQRTQLAAIWKKSTHNALLSRALNFLFEKE